MGGNDGKSGTSQADIDGKLFKVLYELELRLDTKFKEARQQNKEDTQIIVELAVSRSIQPVMAEIVGMKEQLKEGNKRFEDQSSRITKAMAVASQAKDDIASARLTAATEHQFAPQDPNVPPSDKSSGGWISVKEIAPILTAAGILISLVMSAVAVFRTPASEQPVLANPVASPLPRIAAPPALPAP